MKPVQISYSQSTQQVTVTCAQIPQQPSKVLLHLNLSDLHGVLHHLDTIFSNWQEPKIQEMDTRENELRVTEEVAISMQDQPDRIDEESQVLIGEIHKLLQQLYKKGVSTRTIREALLAYQKPSRIEITPDHRILLPDFNNLEIKLPPLPKSLYILYLRHPEGISFKALSEYESELLDIYAQIAPNCNPSLRQRYVKSLITPTTNSLNEKISQIRRALSQILDDSLLPYYVISGEKGCARTIKVTIHPSNP